MNRKPISWRILALIFALILMLPALIGCSSEKNPVKEETKPEQNDPYLFGDDIVVIRGEQSSDGETNAAKRLVNGIKEKTGTMLSFHTDWFKEGYNEPVEREILVGRTNRPEAEGLQTEATGDYLIRLVGKKIVILGSDDRALMNGVERFLNTFINDSGFTFTDSLDEYYDKSEAMKKGVLDEMKGTLNVNYDKIINPEIIGGGVNFDFSSYVFINLINGGEWGTGANRSQHIPYSKNAAAIDKLWEDYFEVMDFTGMSYVRLNVSFTMWEPINDNDDPFNTDFDKGFIFSPHFSEREDAVGTVNTGFPNLNYAYLEAFYRLLDHFEEKGMYVILANWDNGSEALGFCPPGTNWMATKDADGKPLGRSNDLNVADLDEYAETFAAIMYHLIEEKGYTCVKGFSFYNEPENLKDGQNVLCKVYNKFGEHLTRLGIREKTMIQAFDGAILWMACDNGNPNRITDMSKVCGDNMDIFSLHMYLATVESGAKVAGTDVRGTVSTYTIPEVQKILKQAGDKPLVIGELGTFAFNDKNAEGSKKNYMTRILAAESAIELFNAGVKGYGLWVYNCYLHSYYTMLDYDKNDPNHIVPDDVNYYPSALTMRYLPGGTNIVETEVTGCEDSYKHVWACAGIRPDGGKSILLVNDGEEPTEISISGSETYHSFFVDSEHTDNIYDGGEVSDTLVMNPYSIVVLTDKPY